MVFKQYSNPKGTGWFGWIETKTENRVIAFIKLDGVIVWDW